MKVLEGENDLCDVKECYIIREQVLSPQKSENLTTLHVFESEIDVGDIFEALVPIVTTESSC